MGFGMRVNPTKLDVSEWMNSSASRSRTLQVSTPYEVACYSRTANGELTLGSRAMLRTYREPRTPLVSSTEYRIPSVAHLLISDTT
mmetsp:Transcript_44816/g.173922  ORF Transcript_44816/g.173922 Transcript_44816/m.173922 type:complete len:86 (+) Transcript_44816:1381-1638(+)